MQIVYSSGGQLQKRQVSSGGELNLTQEAPESNLIVNNGQTHWLTPFAGQMTYTTSAGETKAVHARAVPDPVELSGPWDVSFPANLGAPENAAFEELTSWSSASDQGVRYFSGTATYRKQFVLPKHLLQPDTLLELDLGTVHVIAEVLVNGKNLGVLWKAPFRVDLDGVARDGDNDLEVRITNLWKNRLIGDAHYPEDTKRKGLNTKRWPDWLTNTSKRALERPTERVAFAAYRHWDKTSPMQTSGLLGPVIIRPYLRVKVETNGDKK